MTTTEEADTRAQPWLQDFNVAPSGPTRSDRIPEWVQPKGTGWDVSSNTLIRVEFLDQRITGATEKQANMSFKPRTPLS